MPNDNQQPITRADLDAALNAALNAHTERLAAIFTTRDVFDRAIDSIAAEFGTMHNEIQALHGEIKSRDEANARRFDRFSETLTSIDARMSAVTKWADTLDRDNAALNARFHEMQRNHQRSIADLERRISALERKAG